MKIRKNGKVVRLTESDLRRIVKKVISENQEDEPTDELIIVFKKYGEILESLISDLESLAKKSNSVHLKSITRNIMETVDEINNLNYDNIDDLEDFMSSMCGQPKGWFKRTLVLSKQVADIYFKYFKQGSSQENKMKFEQRKEIYITIKDSQILLCQIEKAQRSGNTDRVNDLVTDLNNKLDNLLSRI